MNSPGDVIQWHDMEYRLAFLSEDSIGDLYAAFVEAFSDYALDMSHMNEEKFYNRAVKNGIDFESSVGVFDGGKMVGYTLVGVDHWKGRLSAYDIGTGITKPYRGKGIAGEMFRFAVPKLRDRGVKSFFLEVLKENEPAVRAYRKTGFEITREFDCFELDIGRARFEKDPAVPIEVVEIGRERIPRFAPFLDWEPSWENSLASLGRIPDAVMLFEAVHGGDTAGAIAYYPALNWIMCIAVRPSFRRRGVGTALVKHVAVRAGEERTCIRLVNVEHSDEGMIEFLGKIGFDLFTTQYEMEFRIE